MNRRYVLTTIPLLISLFIYLFYRTEKTLINEIFIFIISHQRFNGLREAVSHSLPLNKYIVYSLPEGLWVFCITLTSKSFYIPSLNQKINCIFLPLIFCPVLELLQLLHFTNGRFDFSDIWISILFWTIGYYFFSTSTTSQNILRPIDTKRLVCFASYGIVYLAHVFK